MSKRGWLAMCFLPAPQKGSRAAVEAGAAFPFAPKFAPLESMKSCLGQGGGQVKARVVPTPLVCRAKQM